MINDDLVAEQGTKYRLTRVLFTGDIQRHDRGLKDGVHVAHVSLTRWSWRRVFNVTFSGDDRSGSALVPFEPAAYRIHLKGLMQLESEVRFADERHGDVLVSRTEYPVFAMWQHITNDADVSLVSIKQWSLGRSRMIYRGTHDRYDRRRPLAAVRGVWPIHHELEVLDDRITHNELNAMLFFLILINDLDYHR